MHDYRRQSVPDITFFNILFGLHKKIPSISDPLEKVSYNWPLSYSQVFRHTWIVLIELSTNLAVISFLLFLFGKKRYFFSASVFFLQLSQKNWLSPSIISACSISNILLFNETFDFKSIGSSKNGSLLMVFYYLGFLSFFVEKHTVSQTLQVIEVDMTPWKISSTQVLYLRLYNQKILCCWVFWSVISALL